MLSGKRNLTLTLTLTLTQEEMEAIVTSSVTSSAAPAAAEEDEDTAASTAPGPVTEAWQVAPGTPEEQSHGSKEESDYYLSALGGAYDEAKGMASDGLNNTKLFAADTMRRYWQIHPPLQNSDSNAYPGSNRREGPSLT